jgi:hypothetical protein
LLYALVLICLQDFYVNISSKQLFIITVLSLILSLIKSIYVPIVLILFIIPASKFEIKEKWKVFFAILFILCCSLDILWTTSANFAPADMSEAKLFMLTYPFYTLWIVIKNIILNIPNAIYESLGGGIGFGINGAGLNKILIVFYFLGVLLTILCDQYYQLSIKFRILILIIIIPIMALPFAAIIPMGFFTDAIEGKYVYLTNARYYAPIMFLIILFITSFKKILLPFNREIIFRNMLLVIPFMHLAVFSSQIVFFSKYLIP